MQKLNKDTQLRNIIPNAGIQTDSIKNWNPQNHRALIPMVFTTVSKTLIHVFYLCNGIPKENMDMLYSDSTEYTAKYKDF